MFSQSTIESLSGRVGWRQPTLSGYDKLNATNLASASGYYFNDASNLVSVKNIFETQEDKDISDADFNTYLEELQKSAISRVLGKVFQDKGKQLESVTLFPYEQDFKNTLSLQDGFVGFQINVGTNRRIRTIVRNVMLSFNGEATFNLYLYNSQVKAPIQTKSVTTIDGQTIVNVDWNIDKNASNYKGGTFYIGYFEEDVTGVAPYKKDYELSNYMVQPCNASIDMMRLDHTGTVIDVDGESISDYMGLNLELESVVDFTDLIESKKNLFDRAVMYQMAINVIDIMFTSTRTNLVQRLGDSFKGQAIFALEGGEGSNGLYGVLAREINTVKAQLFKVDKIRRGTMG